ncbi:unnamed protein product [Parascedosporium putredinis]|uniref:Asl1-like glycosyl hydrolase catalytic domain-containing protein n=1 Tax=Parascedosporium putredinis TaxID=1442378 RepID=A0A9P1H7B1_9PEZI|nr:unnamed protein product [Parascedosporium putredinis]CAI7999538.1 unnamed protein product [Parascedosporium putredinis]
MHPTNSIAVITTAVLALSSSVSAANIGRWNKWSRPEEASTSTSWVTVYETQTVTLKASPTQKTVYKNGGQPANNVAAEATTLATQVVAAAETPVAVESNQGASVNVQAVNNAASSSASGGKRGFAYNDANLVNNLVNGGTRGSWAYNWDSVSNGLASGVEFVPMLWGDRADHTNRWANNIEKSLSEGASHILSFNEPDIAAQANLSPEAAAAAHVKYINPYGGRARIGAPAVSNSNLDGQGTRWLKSFMSACDRVGCKIDFCVAHWYSPASDPQSLINHLNEVHSICGNKPVWLTEFAPLGNDQENAAFLKNNLGRLDGELSFLERYSYFMVSVGSLMSSSTSLSSLGQAFFG